MGHGVAQGHWRWTKQAKAWHLGDRAQRGHAGICSVHKHGTCAVDKWARHGFRQPPSVALAPFRGSALVAFSFLFFWRYGDGERRKEKAYRKKNKKYRQNQKRLLHLPNSMTSPCKGAQKSLARTPARLGPGIHTPPAACHGMVGRAWLLAAAF